MWVENSKPSISVLTLPWDRHPCFLAPHLLGWLSTLSLHALGQEGRGIPWSLQKRSSQLCVLGFLDCKAGMIKGTLLLGSPYATLPPPQFSLHSLENQASSLMVAFCFFFYFGSAFVKVSTNLMSQEAGRWPFRPSAWMWQRSNKYWMVRAMEI